MYKTQSEFITNLEKELAWLGITDKGEIIADFELHFADSMAQGFSEAEICSKLGSISEIAKQYAEEEIYPIVAVETMNNEQGTMNNEQCEKEPPPPYNDAYAEYENSGIKLNFKNNSGSKNINGGGLAACICIDVFVLSWAIPTLFAVIVSLLAVPFTLIVTGFVTMFGGIFGTSFANFMSPLPGLVTFFTGLMLLSLGGLFALLGVQLVKLFIKLIKIIIDWHGNMITGKPVFNRQEVNA
jgi:uncharacterized membrane protein